MIFRKLQWLFRRLRCMSVPEMVWRTYITTRNYAGKLWPNEKSIPDSDPEAGGLDWAGKGNPVQDISAYLEYADKVMAGHIAIFAIDDVRLGDVPQWNSDPLEIHHASSRVQSVLDNDGVPGSGEVKYMWEVNRHLQLTALGQAYYLSSDKKYLKGLLVQLSSWFDQCDSRGPNWASSLELGIRLVNWSITWQLIGGKGSPLFAGAEGKALYRRWLEQIYLHCRSIDRHWSLFSSGNNHLIGEAAGLFVACVTWPCWKKSEVWLKKAHRTLEKEALKQNAADGVNREQATSYQQFVLDFLVLSGLAGKRAGRDFSGAYWGNIESMLEYVASIMDVGGNVPMIGDADDGYVVQLVPESGFCNYRSLLATGAVIFDRGDFKRKSRGLDGKTRWLLTGSGWPGAGDLDAQFDSIQVEGRSLPVRKSFPEGGYYILGCDFEEENEVRCIVDAGPLGYSSIAAHGHADALSLLLSVGGREFLIDPGTYVYNSHDDWRSSFRGTPAHNTVTVDHQNQSTQGGCFMWLQKANTLCEKWQTDEEMDLVIASHDGYQRLDDSVMHRREVRFIKQERRLEVIDTITARKRHTIERRWHFSEECEVELEGVARLVVRNNGQTITLVDRKAENGVSGLRTRLESTRSGWVSRRFNVKVPAAVAVWHTEGVGAIRLVTDILID